MHTCTHIYTHTYIHTYIHTHTYTVTYTQIHTHTHIYTHTYTHTDARTHTHTHTHAHTCTHTHTHTCTELCIILYVHIHTYIHTVHISTCGYPANTVWSLTHHWWPWWSRSHSRGRWWHRGLLYNFIQENNCDPYTGPHTMHTSSTLCDRGKNVLNCPLLEPLSACRGLLSDVERVVWFINTLRRLESYRINHDNNIIQFHWQMIHNVKRTITYNSFFPSLW